MARQPLVMVWVLVALAGGVGALCRSLVDAAVSSRLGSRWPWGTFVVNLSGSLAAGVVVGVGVTGVLGEAAVRVVAGGFLGAYTTFSTHAVDALHLLGQRRGRAAAANLLASALLGSALAALGLALVGAL